MDKRFTQAQVDLALRKEQMIQRVEQGESLKVVSQDLGLTYHPKHVSRLRRRYIEGGRHWVALVDGREGGRATKITRKVALWIMGELQGAPNVTASHLCDEVRMRQLAIALGRQGQPGRPRRASPPGVTSAKPLIIEQTPHAGIFFPPGRAVADGDSARHDPCVAKVQRTYLQQGAGPELQILTSRPETIVSKLLTLILLPCLSLERCYNLIGYQGHGLAAVVPKLRVSDLLSGSRHAERTDILGLLREATLDQVPSAQEQGHSHRTRDGLYQDAVRPRDRRTSVVSGRAPGRYGPAPGPRRFHRRHRPSHACLRRRS